MNLPCLRTQRYHFLVRNNFVINAIWMFFFICMIFLTSNAFGENYYISSNGDDNNSGTSNNLPWKTLSKFNAFNFSPGDIISFQRGSVWTGEILVRNSGVLGKPITLTAYGTGVNPIVRNPGTWTDSIKINASYVIIENFLLKDSHYTGILLLAGSVNNIIRDCEFTNMGSAVAVSGSFNLISRNYVHDMTIIINDNAPDNDFGALGFIVSGPNNEISYNHATNLAAPSYDYGTDGGFIDLYGNVDFSYIHHNWVENSMGFFEVGGNTGSAENAGSAKNVRICYNVAVNNRGAFGIAHISDLFRSSIVNFRVENNTIVDVKDYGKYSYSLIWFDSTPSPENFIFRNNIVMLGRFSYFSNVFFNRSYNIYYFLDGTTKLDTVSGSLGSGEIKADPKFVNLQLNNFHLQTDSQAINNGIDLGYTKDYDNLPVPTGNVPDLGAYEFQGGVPSGAPTVTTIAATSVGATTAPLNGNVTPNGLATNAWFEWGTNSVLSSFTSTAAQPVGSGIVSQSVSAALTGLSTGTTYYYRVAASNGSGTTRGSILSFVPGGAPGVTTLPAASVGATTATVNGNVTPNGLATNAWFEYGTDPSLASFTSTSSKSVGSGTTSQSINAALTGLSTGTTYYYRVAASNGSGTTRGSIANFNAGSVTPLKIPASPRGLSIN